MSAADNEKIVAMESIVIGNNPVMVFLTDRSRVLVKNTNGWAELELPEHTEFSGRFDVIEFTE